MKGFTLLETVVTVGVAVMISGLILANFPEFSRRLELSRTAQAVAQSFREAETAALAVREFVITDPVPYSVYPPYGLHFENGPDAREYILFADINNTDEDPDLEGNNLYDEGELVERFTIAGAPVIAGIQAGMRSSGGGTDDSVDALDVVFRRPNPDVVITADGVDYPDTEITLALPTGERRRVVVWKTGQLSIDPLEIPQ